MAAGVGAYRSTRGFTLVELMITIVVIAILVSIAWPTYQDQIRKGRRRAAQAVMMDMADRQQQYLLATRTYAADTATLKYSVPTDVSQFYTWTIAPGPGPAPTFTITFTPIGTQTVDGALTLNQAGDRGPIAKWTK